MNLYKYANPFVLIDRIGIWAIFLMYAIFATTLSLGKSVVQYGPIVSYIGFRMAISGLLLLVYYIFVHKGSFKIKRRDWISFLNIAFLGIFASYVLCFWALQHLSVAKSAFFLLLSPFFTALFSWLHGFEGFSYKKILGLLIGAVGTIPMLLATTGDEQAFTHVFSLDMPEIASLISVALYAYSWIEVKRLINHKYETSFINGMTMFLGGVTTLIFAFFFDGWTLTSTPITDWYAFTIFLAIIVAVGTFCFSLYAHILKQHSPTLVSFFGFTEPFFAAIFACIFLSEPISLTFSISLLVVSSGLYLFYQDDLK